jgi:hypothetical protein
VAALPFVGAQLLYRVHGSRDLDPRTVRIHDARYLAAAPHLEPDGFTCVDMPTAVTDLYDADQIERIYRPETEELIKALTGAIRVLTFRWKWRSSSEDRRQDVWVEDPVKGVPHIDYTVGTVRCFTLMLAPAESDELLRHRFALINVWRPITTVHVKPLTLCDPKSVAVDDLLESTVHPPAQDPAHGFGFPLTGWNLTFAPAHRWYYWPRLQPREVLVFKLADSDPARPQFTGHTAFDDPTSPPGAPPRESFEIRTIAFYPEAA